MRPAAALLGRRRKPARVAPCTSLSSSHTWLLKPRLRARRFRPTDCSVNTAIPRIAADGESVRRVVVHGDAVRWAEAEGQEGTRARRILLCCVGVFGK